MADRESNVVNAFTTTITTEVGVTDLTFEVSSTSSGPDSPCYLVFEPDSDTNREVVYCDGTFTGTTFVTTSLSNRYLTGSAAASGLTHAVGTEVKCVPVAQHVEDLHDRINAVQAALDLVEADLAAAIATFVDKSGATDTLALSDAGKVSRYTNAVEVALTVPTNASVPFDVGSQLGVYSAGTGGVTIAGDSGVTVRGAGTLVQYGFATLLKLDVDEWVAIGPQA